MEFVRKIDYNVNAGKPYLIEKEIHKEKATEIFKNPQIKITTEGHRHLGSVFGRKQFIGSYISLLVNRWYDEICIYSLISTQNYILQEDN